MKDFFRQNGILLLIVAVLLALVILFAAGHLWYALVEMVKDAIARRFFSGKREPWHPLPPDEGDSGDGPPGTV